MSQTQVIVTDSRVLMRGHAENKGACIALSAAIQTFAYVACNLGLLAASVEIDPVAGTADVRMIDDERSRGAISGLMAAFYGIASQVPGSVVLSDNRKQRPEPLRECDPPSDDAASFALASERPRLSTVTKNLVAG